MHGHADAVGKRARAGEQAQGGLAVNGFGPRAGLDDRAEQGGGLGEYLGFGDVRADEGEQHAVVLEHEAEELALHRRVDAVDRPHAADVGRVVAEVGRVVEEHEIAVAQGGVVAPVVHHPDVGAGGDDGAVTGAARAAGEVNVVGDGAELVFEDARAGGLDRLEAGERAEAAGVAHERELGGGFDQALAVEEGREVAELGARGELGEAGEQVGLAGEAAVERIGEHAGVVVAQGVLALAHALGGGAREPERGVEAGEIGREPGDGADLVDAGAGEHERAVLGGEGRAVGGLVFLVARGQVEHGAARAEIEREVGVGDLDAGEVVKIVVLADGVEARHLGRAGQHDQADGRGGGEFVAQAFAAGGELGGGEIDLEGQGNVAGGHGVEPDNRSGSGG